MIKKLQLGTAGCWYNLCFKLSFAYNRFTVVVTTIALPSESTIAMFVVPWSFTGSKIPP